MDKALADNLNLLLLIDLAGNTAAFTVGYGLEPYIQESDLQEVLDELASTMRDHDLATGLRATIEFLTQRLRVLSARARSAPTRVAVPA